MLDLFISWSSLDISSISTDYIVYRIRTGIFLTEFNSKRGIFDNFPHNYSKDKSNIEINQCGTKYSKTNLTGSTISTSTVISHEKMFPIKPKIL